MDKDTIEKTRKLMRRDDSDALAKVSELLERALGGDAKPPFSIGYELSNPRSTWFDQDMGLALQWLNYTAEKFGHAPSWERIGDISADASGDFLDYAKAFAAYDKARKSAIYAQTKFALCLLAGIGCRRDTVRGQYELKEAVRRRDIYWAQIIADTGKVPQDLALYFIPRRDLQAIALGGECSLEEVVAYFKDLPTNESGSKTPEGFVGKATTQTPPWQNPVQPADPDANDNAAKQTDASPAIDYRKQLDALTGLASVKKLIKSIVAVIKFAQDREKLGLPVPIPSLHLVFSGNPGTGKTTVARILGGLLKEIGYLKQGHVVEVSVAEMIGQFVGETPQKVMRKLKQAMGGILFIDEAYSLTSHPTASGGDFGAEAVATILKFMEDKRGEFVIIAAGYPKEMKDFVESNPGFKSRFTEFVEFPDYAPAELAVIYEKMAADMKFHLSAEASHALQETMAEVPEIFEKHFSNGRFVRNVFEDTVKHLALRLEHREGATADELSTITLPDYIAAFDENRRLEDKDRPAGIGFIQKERG